MWKVEPICEILRSMKKLDNSYTDIGGKQKETVCIAKSVHI